MSVNVSWMVNVEEVKGIKTKAEGHKAGNITQMRDHGRP